MAKTNPVSRRSMALKSAIVSTAMMFTIASAGARAHGSLQDLAVLDGLDPMNVPAPSYLAEGSSQCASEQARRMSLAQDQRRVMQMVGGFKTLTSDFDLIVMGIILGYGLPAHKAVSFRDMGVTFASIESLSGKVPHSGRPSLLLFKPNPSRNTTEQFKYDYPMTLAGWGYASNYVPLQRPEIPGLCLFKKDWFFHEQGVHPFVGMGFAPTPPREIWVGAERGSHFQPWGHGWPFGIYHSRFWDIHVFLNESSPVPTVSIIKENSGITGIDPGVGTAFKYPAF